MRRRSSLSLTRASLLSFLCVEVLSRACRRLFAGEGDRRLVSRSELLVEPGTKAMVWLYAGPSMATRFLSDPETWTRLRRLRARFTAASGVVHGFTGLSIKKQRRRQTLSLSRSRSEHCLTQSNR